MGALAKKPEGRYQTVEELRRDIERFQEGRSVSAKHDSLRERTWKMLKRNGAVVDALLADHGLFHLEADLRWIDLTAARLSVLADEVRA